MKNSDVSGSTFLFQNIKERGTPGKDHTGDHMQAPKTNFSLIINSLELGLLL